MTSYRLPLLLLVALLAAVAVAVALRGGHAADSTAAPAGHPVQAPAPSATTATPVAPTASPALVAGIQPEVLSRYRTQAASGDAASQDNLAICYEQGLGVAADPAQAVTWYRASADRGFAPAQFHLGDCYENGKGIARDLEQARHWYQLAAGQGFIQASAALTRIGAGHG